MIPAECEKGNISRFVTKNARLVYSSCNTTKKYLRNKVTTGIKKDAGIYSIPCNSARHHLHIIMYRMTLCMKLFITPISLFK